MFHVSCFINITDQYIFLKRFFFIPALLMALAGSGQVRFSVSSDFAVMRNFSPKQKFWTLGQTVEGNFHFSKKETAYAWINYYIPGKFKNHFNASAKSPSTLPPTINFTASARWRNNEVSLGWKHYFRGSFDAENGWSLYGTAGFGLMFTKVENSFDPAVDTALYNTPLLPGSNQFYRLTLDLGLGVEFPVGGDFFLYSDIRTWIPSSGYPSPYLHNTKNVPLPAIVSGGLRILFGY
jgi:hypothetical protein